MTRTELSGGVFLTYLPAKKFKTSVLSAQFIVPLRWETASANALFSAILRRGTVTYPDMGALSARLDRLYGARIDATIRKRGEAQCVGFVASLIDDCFAPGGERLLEPAADLLGELICRPVTRDGLFLEEYFENEKTNLIDAIRSILNDKRAYADSRLLQEMCTGEPYGVPRLGNEQITAALHPQMVFDAYRELISSSRLEIFYSGSAERSRVEDALRSALADLPRKGIEPSPAPVPHVPAPEPRVLTERLDVTQGKLGMGFSCGSEDAPALLLGNTLFGGSSNSKLFLNVREKLSLCYYASSNYHRQKGLITVSSGIEFENYQKALDEITAQLEAVRKGRLEDWELEAARSTLLNAYASMGDSQGKLENFYLGQTATGRNETQEELADQVRSVTQERICQAMSTVKLDTVYFLQGKEAEA